MRYLFCCLAFFFTVRFAHAQTATDSVKVAINNLFIAIRQADSVALMQCFAPGSVLQTVSKSREGKVTVRTEPIPDFASSVGKLNRNEADERIVYDVIRIDGELAMVWTPYQLYFKGNFNHCGVNSFQLVKLDGAWKIQYIIDTRRTEACVEQ